MKQTILLFGKNGQVGWELQRTLAVLGSVVAVGRGEVDLTDEMSIRSMIRQVEPTTIVNAAAYTSENTAESEPLICSKINSVAPGIMANEANAIGALLVHYSTDFVFDGKSQIPYTEEDGTNPLNVYGQTKLVGDLAVRRVTDKQITFRTSMVFGRHGNNVLTSLERLVRERDTFGVVGTTRRCPTWARAVAEVTSSALALVFASSDPSVFTGMYNVACPDTATLKEFAEAVAECVPADERSCRSIESIAPVDYPTPAQKPEYSALDCSKLRSSFGLSLPPWRECLRMAMNP